MRVSACLTLLLALTPAGRCAEGPVSYAKEILPLFRQQCQGCHQPAKAQGGYLMVSHADLLKSGDRAKPGVVPGKPAESFLLTLLKPTDMSRMPRGKKPLSDVEIALVERWIAEGAKDDTPASARLPEVDAAHPPVYELPPVVTALAYSPDGSLLAASGYHEVILHKADGSAIEARLVGLSERIQSIAFSPDGQTLAVGGGSPARFGEIQLWDLAKKKLRLSIPVTADTVYGLSWSPDGSKVAVGCADNTLRAFDAKTGEQVLFQGVHSDWVMDTAWSHDGLFLASVGPRPLDEVDRCRHATVHRQRDEHYPRRSQRRPHGLGPPTAGPDHAAAHGEGAPRHAGRSAEGVRRVADRRGRRPAASV